eukprot:scaffold7761_cov417-Prasinococcus_capsulatus_cf.AAC.4
MVPKLAKLRSSDVHVLHCLFFRNQRVCWHPLTNFTQSPALLAHEGKDVSRQSLALVTLASP